MFRDYMRSVLVQFSIQGRPNGCNDTFNETRRHMCLRPWSAINKKNILDWFQRYPMLFTTLIIMGKIRPCVITVYPKKYAHGFCFAVLCCGYTLTDFPITIRLTSLALWQSNDCPSASNATLVNMDKYFMWIHYERLHNHNKAKHNKPVCIFLGIYCRSFQDDYSRTNNTKPCVYLIEYVVYVP